LTPSTPITEKTFSPEYITQSFSSVMYAFSKLRARRRSTGPTVFCVGDSVVGESCEI
jgi:hypothetical protein